MIFLYIVYGRFSLALYSSVTYSEKFYPFGEVSKEKQTEVKLNYIHCPTLWYKTIEKKLTIKYFIVIPVVTARLLITVKCSVNFILGQLNTWISPNLQGKLFENVKQSTKYQISPSIAV